VKIVQVTRNFSAGGGERFVIDLSNRLVKSADEVIILRLDDEKKNNIFEPDVNKEVRIVTIKKRTRKGADLPKRIYRFLKNEKPDIVHVHLSGFIYSVLSFFFLRKIAFFYTIHSLIGSRKQLNFYLKRYFFKRNIVTPVAISEEVKKDAMRMYGLKNITLICNGRSQQERSPEYEKEYGYIEGLKMDPGTKIIINKGRVSVSKNQSLLIETVNQLNLEGYNVKLLIIGSMDSMAGGVSSENILKDLKNIGNENIIYMGEVANVQDYLFAGDIFSLSSLREGMPISLIEAFSAGCVPVCTPAGGVASMIQDGENGFLAAGFSKSDLTEAFKRYMNCDKAKINYISENAKKNYEAKYSIKTAADKYINLYKGIPV
jgi:glycosyltransferase involved in cell wall biosynthesis